MLQRLSGSHSARPHRPGYGEPELLSVRPSTSSPRARHDKEMLDTLNTISQASSFYSPPRKGGRTSSETGSQLGTSYFLPALDANGTLMELEPSALKSGLFSPELNGVSAASKSPYLDGGTSDLRKKIGQLELEISRLRASLDKKVHTIRRLEEREVSRQYEDDVIKARLTQQWQAELERTRQELEAKYRHELAGARHKSQDEVATVASSWEEEVARREAKEKEARIELLRRQVARRMKNSDLARGFTAWNDLWKERTRVQQLLRQAAARLTKPALSHAYLVWKLDWDEKVKADLKAAREEFESSLLTDKERLQIEMQKMRDECERKLASLQLVHEQEMAEMRIAAFGSAEEQARQRDLKEKEARIALYRRKVTRRIMNSDLARGWTAWVETWEARIHSRRLLQSAASRLTKPVLSSAFGYWRTDWRETEREQAERTNRELAEKLQQRQLDAEQELTEQRQLHAQELAAMSAKHARDLERLRVELTGTAEEREAMRDARERDERVELLRRQVTRRMLSADLSRGWTAWFAMWDARRRSKQRLQQAANRLVRPLLTAAYLYWRTDWRAAYERAAAAERQKGLSELQKRNFELEEDLREVREAAKKSLAEMAEKCDVAMSRLRIELTGSLVEQAAVREEREKEARVELLRRQSARRIANAELSRGWSTWKLGWQARVDRRRMIKGAAMRMMRPLLFSAYGFWKHDWDSKQRSLQEAARSAETGKLLTRQQELERALSAKDAEWEAKLARMREQQKEALENQRIALVGTAEERMAYAKSKDKEARVEQLRRQVARRMIHKELARGWTAWAAKRAALAKKKQMLKQAAARLTRPALSASYRYWLKDFQEATKADDARRQRRELDALEVQLSESMYRVHELNMIRVAHEDEIEALKAKLRHSEEEVRTQESTVTDLRPRCMQQASQIVNLEAELESAKNAARDAERERDVAREQARMQHDANEALLARLLAEQRATFELELRELKEVHSTMLGERIGALESELRAESEQLLEVRQSQLETQERLRLESDSRSQVEAELGTTREKLDVTIGTLEERKAELSQLHRTVGDLNLAIQEKDRQIHSLESQIPKKKEPPPKPKGSSGVLGAIDLDEGPDAPPISEQIASALRSGAGRVLDLFREWDADGDGEISRREFHKAMPALGLEVPKADVDKLFDEWGGGDGTITYKEMSQILKAKPKPRVPMPAKK